MFKILFSFVVVASMAVLFTSLSNHQKAQAYDNLSRNLALGGHTFSYQCNDAITAVETATTLHVEDPQHNKWDYEKGVNCTFWQITGDCWDSVSISGTTVWTCCEYESGDDPYCRIQVW